MALASHNTNKEENGQETTVTAKQQDIQHIMHSHSPVVPSAFPLHSEASDL